MPKLTAEGRKLREVLDTVQANFPEFPLAKVKSSAYPNLMLSVILYKDKRSLHLMQQQSHLSEALRGNYD